MSEKTETVPPAPKWEILEEGGSVCVDGFCLVEDKPQPTTDSAPPTGKPEEKQQP